MIIRVRTNIGTTRLEVDPSYSLSQLQELIIRTLNIGSVTVTLAYDHSGQYILSPNEQNLSELGIEQGSEVFVIGKFEKRVVEKSYINDQGEVVPAGQSLVQVHVEEDGQQCEPAERSNKDPSTEKEQPPPAQQELQTMEEPKKSSQTSEVPQKAGNTNDAGIPDSARSSDEPFDYNDYNDALDYEEMNDVRAPDEARTMTLLGDAAGYDIGSTEAGRALMLEVLTKEELRQIDELERSLRAAGLREYEVLQETQHLQDELIAARLQRESAMDARTMAAADLLRHGSADLLSAVHDVDASLARYHAAQRPPQPSVLQLQQFQQGNRAATKPSQGNSKVSGAKSTNTATATAAAAGAKPSSNARDRDVGPAIVTDRSASQHSDITQSSASSLNNANPRSTASSIKGSTKSRQPSKAFTEAMQELHDITQNIEDLASSTNVRLSALQQGALRTLSAPTPTSAVLSRAQRTPARSLNVDTAGAGTASNVHRGGGSHVPLINALSPTSTLSKSIASPARTDRVSNHGNHNTNNAYTPSQPFGAFPEENAGEQKDYDIDEEALLMLLSGEMQSSSRPASAAKKTSSSRAAVPKSAAQRNATEHTPVARAQSYSVAAIPKTSNTSAPSTSTGPAAPAPSLLDSGYKTMAQIKAEKEKEKRDPVNVRIGHTGRAASMSNVKAPVSSGARSNADAAGGVRSERAAAPYSLQAHRGILQADESSAGAGNGRVGGVATTVVAHKAHSSPSANLLFADDAMDDSLALALQLSLEDSQQQQAQMRQRPVSGNGHSGSAAQHKPPKTTTTRTKKAAAATKVPEASAQPSTLLPSSRRPIPVLLPPSQARRHPQDAMENTGAAAGTGRTNSDGNRGREPREAAAAAGAASTRRLVQERLQQERRVQEQLDAETAAELMRQDEADETAAREYQLALDREAESHLLRQHLHGGRSGGVAPAGALPGWLDRTVNDFTNDALYDLAAQRSFQQQQQAHLQPQQHRPQPQPQVQYQAQPAAQRQAARPQRPAAAAYDTYNYGDANYMDVEYDQDDEILAQAIQNSLNETFY